MNERIKELVTQTDVWCDQHWYGNPMYDVHWEEKFAELLIRECINVASKYDEPKMSGPGLMIGQMIEQHFGVE